MNPSNDKTYNIEKYPTLLSSDWEQEEEELELTKEMIEIWNQFRPKGTPLEKWSRKNFELLLDIYFDFFNANLKEWETYCKKLSVSNKKNFTLKQALKKEQIKSIQKEITWKEFLQEKPHNLTSISVHLETFRKELKNHCLNALYDPCWYSISNEMVYRCGVKDYKTYLMEIYAARLINNKLILRVTTPHIRDQIEESFGYHLRMATKAILPHIEEVQIVSKK